MTMDPESRALLRAIIEVQDRELVDAVDQIGVRPLTAVEREQMLLLVGDDHFSASLNTSGERAEEVRRLEALMELLERVP